jgi:replicative superfamily II helicase
MLIENGEVYELPEVSEIKKIDVPKARKIYSAAYDDFIQLGT